MKLNIVLYRQHIGRMFKKHWIVQGKRTPIDTTQEIQNELLKIKNDINIVNPKHLFQTEDRQQFLKHNRVDIDEINKKSIYVYDTSNNLKEQDRACHIFNDSNVLVGGIEQAKVLLNTLQLHTADQIVLDKLVNNEQQLSISKQLLYKQVEDAIKSSHLFDSEQVKLPVYKDPSKPAWNFPRTYGISYQRKIELLTTKLLKICETLSANSNKNKYLLNNGTILTSFEKDSLLYQLDVTIDKLLTSNQRLPPIITDYQQYIENNQSQSDQKQINNSIHPLKCNISIPTTFNYDFNRNIYPINNVNYIPHTLFVSYNKCNVHNLYETEVTDEQITSRTLVKLYATVASYAQQFNLINKETQDISEPMTIQSVTSDGQFYEFGILQVNTINLNNNVQNIWWTSNKINLFDQCKYLNGRPTCTSTAGGSQHFNIQVIDYLFAFYNRQ